LVAFHLPGSQAPLPAVFVFSSCYTQGDAGKLPAFHAKLPNLGRKDELIQQSEKINFFLKKTTG
jgi:hypothetical protein